MYGVSGNSPGWGGKGQGIIMECPGTQQGGEGRLRVYGVPRHSAGWGGNSQGAWSAWHSGWGGKTHDA